MGSNSYGTIRLVQRVPPRGKKPGNFWQVTCEPHVMMELRRVFASVTQESKSEVFISDSPEVCSRMDWFLLRYPMVVEGRDRLTQQARAHNEQRERIRKIISGELIPESLSTVMSTGGQQYSMALMAKPPRAYQEQGAALVLTARRLLLTDDLGLGKTVTALRVISDPRARPTLVVSPLTLLDQWRNKAAEFVPGLTTRILPEGAADIKKLTQRRGKAVPFPDILLTSYGSLHKWHELLAGVVKHLVFDEAHELRRGESRKYEAARFLSEHADYVLGMTHTPIWGYGSEIFYVLDAIAPGRLGTEAEFSREWCGGNSLHSGASVEKPRELGSFLHSEGLMLRRTRAQVGRELPPVTRMEIPVLADMKIIEEAEEASYELARIILEQQGVKGFDKIRAQEEMDNKVRQATGIAKAPFVADFARMVMQGGEGGRQPVVLAGFHHAVYDIWAERLKDLNPVFLTGKESPAQKRESLRRFISGETDLLIISVRAGAGIDGLQQRCSTLIVGELDWAEGVHEQLIGRLDRDGQTQNVFAYFCLSEAGSDPVMADVANVKRGQLVPLRDPDADLSEAMAASPEKVMKLAQYILERRAAKQAA